MSGETPQMGGGMGGSGGVPAGGAGPGGANSFKTPEACRYGPEPLVERRVSPLPWPQPSAWPRLAALPRWRRLSPCRHGAGHRGYLAGTGRGHKAHLGPSAYSLACSQA
eukprot:scaffold68453_cov32-Phaeocystis_antarctica.AAC.2